MPDLMGELRQCEEDAARMERLAFAALQKSDASERERVFAGTLLRNAKGARLAVAAWSQELRNR